MLLIKMILIVTAAYSGGMWLWLCGLSLTNRSRYTMDDHMLIERQTFHLGLCMILALGFLGLILE
jgi:hypothetical protein